MASSSRDYQKTWLLHCVQEPIIDGQTFQVIRDEKGYNGKLINNVLLPQADDLLIRKEGGRGKEYAVSGNNYSNRLIPSDNSGDGAAWRVEVSPINPSAINQFLNVMQIMDADCKVSSLSVKKIVTEEMVGARIYNRIVLFSKNGDAVEQPIKLTIKGKQPVKVLITDVKTGKWQITHEKKTISFVNSADGCLYFMALPGEYRITKMPKG